MPSIYETIKTRMVLAIKNREQARKDLYRFLKGKLDQVDNPTDEVATKLIRSLLKEAEANPGCFTGEDMQEMRDLVPSLLDLQQTLALLSEEVQGSIRTAKAEGQAMGLAMKNLKGQPVDAEVVKYIVLKLRENS